MTHHVSAILLVATSSWLAPPLPAQRAARKPLPPILARAMKTVSWSFVYDGKASEQLLPAWRRSQAVKPLPGGREQTIATYTDPVTGLEVVSEATVFTDHGAVEWVLRLRNTGFGNTGIIERVLPVNLDIPAPPGEVVFHHVLGSAPRASSREDSQPGMTSDYRPIDKRLGPGTECRLVHYGMKEGVHVESHLPFFNRNYSGRQKSEVRRQESE